MLKKKKKEFSYSGKNQERRAIHGKIQRFYLCAYVCVCVCVYERERQRERLQLWFLLGRKLGMSNHVFPS